MHRQGSSLVFYVCLGAPNTRTMPIPCVRICMCGALTYTPLYTFYLTHFVVSSTTQS